MGENRFLWLESLDGSQSVPISLTPQGQVLAARGLLGLGVNPSDLTIDAAPGAAGGHISAVHYPPRPVTLPLSIVAADPAGRDAQVEALREITTPRGVGRDGSFRLVCRSAAGERQLTLAYVSGLEGTDTDRGGTSTLVLEAIAPQPFAEDLNETVVAFSLGDQVDPFVQAPGSDAPWPRRLSASMIEGGHIAVRARSDAATWPTIEVRGPLTSALLVSEGGTRIEIPEPIPAGATLHVVSDPRRRTIRYREHDDAPWEPGVTKLARSSRFAPLVHGGANAAVEAVGATPDTMLRLSWRNVYRSLW